jgi:hypothetical protein
MNYKIPPGSSPNHLITETEILQIVPGNPWVVVRSANTRDCTRFKTLAQTTSKEAAQAALRLLGS